MREDKNDEAWAAISEVLNIDMDDPQGLYMAGVFLRRKGFTGAAAQMFRRCVSLDPSAANPWVHFGVCLHDLHLYDEALEVFGILEKLIPGEPGNTSNIAASYVQKGEFHKALNYANMALESEPTHKRALAVKGMACLGLERWAEGFKQYKNLYGSQITIRTYCNPEEPEWDGTKGLTVVVQGEQGLGDEIRYASILNDMAKDVKVIFDCHPKLEAIMKRSFPNISVYGTRKMKENVSWLGDYKIDARHHISGIGQFYRKRNEDFPRKPYLIPNEELRAKWREKLKDLPRPLVGLAWQGGNTYTGRELRSTLLKQWKPLLEYGGSFVDLSYHDSKSEVESVEPRLFRPECDESNYDDTLALLAELDLTICVPTTVMHACGAIGKPVWVLVPPYTPWEFGLNRKDMIWYQEGLVRLFRSRSHDFSDTIDEIAFAYATDFHRTRPEATTGLHGASKLDHPASEQASPDNTPRIATVTNYSKRSDRVHF